MKRPGPIINGNVYAKIIIFNYQEKSEEKKPTPNWNLIVMWVSLATIACACMVFLLQGGTPVQLYETFLTFLGD